MLFLYAQVRKEVLEWEAIEDFQVSEDLMVVLAHLDVRVNLDLMVYQARSLYVFVVCGVVYSTMCKFKSN